MIHRNALAVGILPDQFTDILNMVVSIINKIKCLHYIQDNSKLSVKTKELILLDCYIIQKSGGYHVDK